MKKISVVVPVYNVEKYLSKCIDSILNQTFKNYELILVNDGSTDNCGNICNDYKNRNKNKNIILINKENGGLSDARNYGLEKATGEYIVFIDSDDYIKSDYLEILYNFINENEADIVIAGKTDFYENSTIIEQSEEIIVKELSKKEAYRKMLLQEDIDVSAWAKIYKTKLFKENGIVYPKGKIYEDIQIIGKLIENSKKIMMTNYKGYYYLQRPGSIMYSSMSLDRMILLEASKSLMQFIQKNYPDIEYAAIKRYIYCSFHILGRAINNKDFNEISINIRKEILSYKKDIYKGKYFTKKEKIATRFLSLGIKPYKFFWNAYCKISNKSL